MSFEISYTELLKGIKEINIVNNIINNVKESQKLDKWDNIINMYKKLENELLMSRGLWYNISLHIFLPLDFIRKYHNKVNWYQISKCQRLDEEIIREFQHKIYWVYIGKRKKLSENFIR